MTLPATLAFAGLLLLAAPDARSQATPQPVMIRGYAGEAMEPHLTRDRRFLLFNNLNQPPTDTNLYYAERIDDLTFQFRGEIAGANTASLEGTPTIDRLGNVRGLVYAPCISADGLRLFFTRIDPDVQRGAPALYLAKRPDRASPFGLARRLTIDGFVEGPALSPDGAWLYFHKRDGAHYAIYRAPAD